MIAIVAKISVCPSGPLSRHVGHADTGTPERGAGASAPPIGSDKGCTPCAPRCGPAAGRSWHLLAHLVAVARNRDAGGDLAANVDLRRSRRPPAGCSSATLAPAFARSHTLPTPQQLAGPAGPHRLWRLPRHSRVSPSVPVVTEIKGEIDRVGGATPAADAAGCRHHTVTVGDKSADRTPSGLWPSDHAGAGVNATTAHLPVNHAGRSKKRGAAALHCSAPPDLPSPSTRSRNLRNCRRC